MDPLCHTLVGAALGQAGLKRRTGLAMPILLIGANLPDIDVLAYFGGNLASLEIRRGWTHGVLAMAVLPLLLTAAVHLYAVARHKPGPGQLPVRPAQVLLLSAISILTHPFLDFMNTYGVRWLMPFSDRWFYGDVLFIADPWVWATLAFGIVWSARRGRQGRADSGKPARLALLVMASYIILMSVSEMVARHRVSSDLATSGVSAERLLVAPVPVDPLVRDVLIETNGSYRRARFHWIPLGALEHSPSGELMTNAGHPAAVRAAETDAGRRFLRWARFPYYRIQPLSSGYRVRIVDARYDAGWSSVVVDVPATLAEPPSGTTAVDSIGRKQP